MKHSGKAHTSLARDRGLQGFLLSFSLSLHLSFSSLSFNRFLDEVQHYLNSIKDALLDGLGPTLHNMHGISKKCWTDDKREFNKMKHDSIHLLKHPLCLSEQSKVHSDPYSRYLCRISNHMPTAKQETLPFVLLCSTRFSRPVLDGSVIIIKHSKF